RDLQCGSYLSSRLRSRCQFLGTRWARGPHLWQSRSEVVGGVQHPGISSLGRKERQRADGDKAGIIFSSPVLNVVDLLRETKLLTLYPLFPRSTLDLFTVHVVLQSPVASSSHGTYSGSFSAGCCSLYTTASIESSSTVT